MTTPNALTEGIANADAIVAGLQITCELCNTQLTEAEIQAQLQTGDKVEAMCDACANTEAVDAAPEAEAAPEAAVDVEAVLAENAKLKAQAYADALAENQRLKANEAAKAAKALKAKGKTPPVVPPVAPVAKAANVSDTPLLPTDIAAGLINPKHLTPGDIFLREVLAKYRTKAKADDNANMIRGTMQRSLFSFFGNKRDGCGFSQEKTNGILEDALKRNVVSKKAIVIAKTGEKMIVWFDSTWRPNIKANWTPADATLVAKAKTLYGA